MKNTKKRWSRSYCCCIHSFQPNFFEIKAKTMKMCRSRSHPSGSQSRTSSEKGRFCRFLTVFCEVHTEREYGSKKIADELERLGRKTATGLTKWHPETILAILKNPTYTGTQAYGKSYVNNYLEQKRIMNKKKCVQLLKCVF